MKLNLKSKKQILYLSISTFILIAGIFAINALMPGTKHSESNILVTINDKTMTLQEAVDGGYLVDGADTSSMPAETQSLAVGHSASEILIYVNQEEDTLNYFLTNEISLCGDTNPKGFYSSSINPGHLASEIEITVGAETKTLQQAIDAGNFCVTTTYSYSDWGDCGTCSVTCGGGTCTKTRTCGKYDNGVFVENVACSYCGDVCSTTDSCNTQACPTTCTFKTDYVDRWKWTCTGSSLGEQAFGGSFTTLDQCAEYCGGFQSSCAVADTNCGCYDGDVVSGNSKYTAECS